MEFSAFSTALEGMVDTGFASDLDAAAKYLHDLDIHYLDAFHGAYRRDPGAFDLYTQKLGFRINSLIGPSESTSEDPAVRKASIDVGKQLVDLAVKYGASNLMLLPYTDDLVGKRCQHGVLEWMPEALAPVVEYATSAGIYVTVENYSVLDRPYTTIAHLNYLMEQVPGMKYTLDSGNFACICEDVLEAYEVLKPDIVNIHLKDWKFVDETVHGAIRTPEDRYLAGTAVGAGILPSEELIKRIKADGYDGRFLLEVANPDKVATCAYINQIWNG